MRKVASLLIISFFLLLTTKCFAQENLVRNGSFEELAKCPAESYIFPAKYWFALQGTPDLFAACVPQNHALAVPGNFKGTRSTFADYNYAGLFLVFQEKGFSERNCYLANEALGTRTTKTLRAGKHYRISLLLSLADSAEFCADSIYCFFSTKAPIAARPIKQGDRSMGGSYYKFQRSDNYGCSLNFACRGCWNRIEIDFIAKQDYNYLSIGLPRARYSRTQYLRDIAKPVRSLSASKWAQKTAYYYLDDIKLIEE